MARPIVRASMGTTLVKRGEFNQVTIPDVTSVDFDNPLTIDLLACQEGIEEEIESTGGTTPGTDVAVVPVYSRLVSLKLQLAIVGATGTANFVRWVLFKSPDNDVSITSLANNNSWNASNDTQVARELRKYTMAKGFVITNPSSATGFVRAFVRRSNMRRMGPFREGDRIKLVLAKDSAGTACTLSGMMNAYVKANG